MASIAGRALIPMHWPASGALTALLCLALAPAAFAAEEDRGPRGFYLGSSGGVVVGTAQNEEGVDGGSFFGNGGVLRLGEEVLPNFTLGLVFGGGGGTADRYDSGIGGFYLEATYRIPSTDLLFHGGTGVGGGSLTPKGDDGLEAVNGGATFLGGLSYEFVVWGEATEGLAVGPVVWWFFIPPTGENEAIISAFSLGGGARYYFGR